MIRKTPGRTEPPDSLAIGWISMAELFLLVGLVMIAVCVLLAGRHAKAVQAGQAVTKVKEGLAAEKADLTNRLSETKDEAGKKADEVSQLQDELEWEKEQREQQEKKWKEDQTTLQTRLKQRDEQLDGQKERIDELERQVDGHQKVAEGDRQRRQKLEQLLEKHERSLDELGEKLDEYELKLAKANERIVRPLEKASLIVRLRADSLPDGLDLDLYLQDPLDRLCSWRDPRVISTNAETAFLIPSDDLRHEDETTEEIYYATEILQKSNKPYLIFAMLRRTEEREFESAEGWSLQWELTIRNADGSETIRSGTAAIRRSGDIVVADGKRIYPGLSPVAAFAVTGSEDYKVNVLALADVPGLPRTWDRKRVPDDAERFMKIREQ